MSGLMTDMEETSRTLSSTKHILWRIGTNVGSVSFANIAEKALFFVLLTIVARELGPGAYGDLITAFVFVNIAFIFGELGLILTANREVARNKDEASKYFNNILGIRSISLPVTALAITLALSVTDYPSEIEKGIFVFLIYFVLLYLSHAFIAIFRAFERMELVALMVLIDRGTVTVLGCLMLLNGADLFRVEYVFILGGAARIVIGLIFVRRIVGAVGIEYDFAFWKETLRKSIPLGLYMILTLVYFRIDTLLLSFLGYGSSEVGWYNAGYNIFAILMLPSLAYSQAVFPVISRLQLRDIKLLKKYYVHSLYFLTGAGLFVAVVTYFLAVPIINVLYGSDYPQSVVILKILSVAALFSLVSCFNQWMFIAVDCVKELLQFMAGAAALNIVLNLVFIPLMASKGAALTTACTELVFGSFSTYLFLHITNKRVQAKVIVDSISSP
jgi:O-antigen/teichoic acid export membrane protein